jgi:hypothetical protein
LFFTTRRRNSSRNRISNIGFCRFGLLRINLRQY